MKMFRKMHPVNQLAVLLFALLLPLVGFTAVWATTDTFNTPTPDQTVSGVPLCVTFNGASASSAEDLTVTLPTGFNPTYVQFIPHWNSTVDTEQDQYEWFYGMTNGSARGHLNGSIAILGVHTDGTATPQITTSASSIVISSEAQINSGNYVGRACR